MQGRSSGELLDTSSAVALLGPRQVGKTMIVSQIAQSRPAIYLDLETDADPAKLAEPELYLGQHDDSCHSR